jgi:hypothetical protein
MEPPPKRPLTSNCPYGKLTHSKTHDKSKRHALYATTGEDLMIVESQLQLVCSEAAPSPAIANAQTAQTLQPPVQPVIQALTTKQLKRVQDTILQAYGVDVDWFLSALGCSSLLEFALRMGYTSVSELYDNFFVSSDAVRDCQVLLFYSGCRNVFEYQPPR